MLISLFEVCHECGVKQGCTWKMLWVPDWINGGQGYPGHHEWYCFIKRKVPPKNLLTSLIEVCQEWDVKKGRSLIRNITHRVIPDVMNEVYLHWGRNPENFVLISKLEVCQEVGTWKMLRVPDRTLGGQGQPWRHGWLWRTLRIIYWKFGVIIFIFGWDKRVC